jgi:tetratricopeptide (TPR) repeat protein
MQWEALVTAEVAMRRRSFALLLLALPGALTFAAAPPDVPPYRRTLGPADDARVAALDRQVHRALRGQHFAEAEKAARALAELRSRAQGERHWQTVDARWMVKRARLLAHLTPEQLQEWEQANRDTEAGAASYAKARFAEGLTHFSRALQARRRLLGEGHPDTSQGYHNVAGCLYALGKIAQAQPLFEKALVIDRNTLGEDHPETANSYNAFAQCFSRQGQHALALPLLEKALRASRRTVGEDNVGTAALYDNVGACLQEQGKYAQALPLHRKALGLRRALLGEKHALTALSSNNLASCLQAQGRLDEALPLYREALRVKREVQGEEHFDTARSYHNLGFCLQALGHQPQALPLFQKAVAIFVRTVGEDNPHTARSRANAAFCLQVMGKNAEALPLFRRALEGRRRALGEDHPETANSRSNLAYCLNAQGKHALAVSLYRQALITYRQVLGEKHPHTATCRNNLAHCLRSQGNHAAALALHRKALEAQREVLGEEHPNTLRTLSDLAVCLNAQGRYADALPLLRKALAGREKAHGEGHPEVAISHHNLASALNALGKPAEALPHFRKARAIFVKVRGEAHPGMATICHNLALCLRALGEDGKAAQAWEQALLGHEIGRLDSAAEGFDRAVFQARREPVRRALACALLRLKRPLEAWQHLEADLARGLLDTLPPDGPEAGRPAALLARLHQLDRALLPLALAGRLSDAQERRREAWARERHAVLAKLAKHAVARAAERVLPLGRIQAQLPADGALVCWLDVGNDHWGCVIRKKGPPRWQRLPGSGEGGAWSDADDRLPDEAYATLRSPAAADWQARAKALYRQRLAPLERHLKAEAEMPAVRRLVVVPTGAMARVPVEALTGDYQAHYALSGSLFARGQARPLAARPLTLLAVGDPVFKAPDLPEPPEHGLFVRRVLVGGSAARSGLRAGDVLLDYAGKKLTTLADLKEAYRAQPAEVRYWRAGKVASARLAAGALGAAFERRRPREAAKAWREGDPLAVRGTGHKELPGTRREVEALARLVGEKHATVLLRSQASEQELDRLGDRRKMFRALHFATHGEVDYQRPGESALILAQDRLGRHGRHDGRLRVSTILEHWELDCDLVVLSACETGLGQDAGGEGLLGFAQAFLQVGARSVVLSRWQVDDEATALLMVRFYQNLLGKRDGLKGPMPKAEALYEAKDWLRNLSAKEVKAEAERLPRGKADRPVPLRKEARPFARPYYWAAFVLIGDPR